MFAKCREIKKDIILYGEIEPCDDVIILRFHGWMLPRSKECMPIYIPDFSIHNPYVVVEYEMKECEYSRIHDYLSHIKKADDPHELRCDILVDE